MTRPMRWILRAALSTTVATLGLPVASSVTPGPAAIGRLAAQLPDANPGRQVALVTGSTDGLGREVALRLGSLGAHVIVHGRNLDRGAEVVAAIEAAGGSAEFLRADFAELEQVRALARTVLERHERLDLLVNNAGIGSGAGDRELSRDGHELRFQVNYLAGFLLTQELLPLLRASAPARIVNVASSAQNPIDFEDVMLERGYTGARAYGQSKLAQILFTVDLAEALDGTDVTVLALHPATFMDTAMVRSTGRLPLSTVEEGAEAVLHLVTTPGLESGRYFNQARPAEPHPQALDPEARARLRVLSQAWVGGS